MYTYFTGFVIISVNQFGFNSIAIEIVQHFISLILTIKTLLINYVCHHDIFHGSHYLLQHSFY